jgi:molybdenum cofactor cytidylyltransferase
VNASQNRVAGIILAAGASRRMGRTKALLDYRGQTFLDRLIGLFHPYCERVIVVLGYGADEVRQGCRRAMEAEFVENPDPGRGQLSSLQAGLSVLPGGMGAVLFTPVDYPAIGAGTIASLCGGLAENPAPVIVPACGARTGHPVLISREVAAELMLLPPTAQAREVIRRYDRRVIEVGDPGILEDIDDPAAYERLLANTAAP